MGLIAIGDVHGCRATLEALLDTLGPTRSDHVVFVGDYIDRGPDSRGVLDRCVELQAMSEAGTGPTCTFLRGNHDQMLLDFVDTGDLSLWRVNGGLGTLAQYQARREIVFPSEHVAFLRGTPLVHDTPAFTFVHAGLDPHLSVAENLKTGTPDVFLWMRGHLNAPLSAWEKPVVCGHTPVSEPVNREKLIDIDTGCVYVNQPNFGWLTAVRLPEREFVRVRFQD